MTVADVIWLPQQGRLKISSALQTVTCLKCGCITRIQTEVIKSILFIVYYECPCRRQQNQKPVEMPFVIYFAKLCFFLSLRVQAADPFVEVRLWKPTANLTQGANADPKRAGQMSAHTPALCRCLPAEMSNTMMWEEAGGELSACHYQVRKPKKFSCEDADSYVWIHGSHRHTCTLIWMTTKWPTNLIQAVTGTITCF